MHTANFPARPEAREQHGASRQPRAVTRLVLVHPSLVVRAGLGSLLTGSGLVGSVSPCASIADAVRQGGRPDLVLFVVNRSSAREAAQVAADLWPTARRVALAEGDIDEAAACLSAGVAAVIAVERIEREQLIDAISSVLDGNDGLVVGFAEAADGTRPSRSRSAAAGLTRREEEILYLIGEGLANTEIADALALSRKTVETHRTKLGQKLGIPTRSGLIHFALNEFQGGGAR